MQQSVKQRGLLRARVGFLAVSRLTLGRNTKRPNRNFAFIMKHRERAIVVPIYQSRHFDPHAIPFRTRLSKDGHSDFITSPILLKKSTSQILKSAVGFKESQRRLAPWDTQTKLSILSLRITMFYFLLSANKV